jgi:hypothetical protein
VARLHLSPNEELCGADRVRAAAPRRSRETGFRPGPQQRVPRGVKANLIDAVAEPVVRVQFRRMFVRVETECDRLGPSGELAQPVHLVDGGPRRLASHRLGERLVGRENVVVLERRRLIFDRVRRHLRRASL